MIKYTLLINHNIAVVKNFCLLPISLNIETLCLPIPVSIKNLNTYALHVRDDILIL